MRPAASARASRPNPRAWPASASCPCAERVARGHRPPARRRARPEDLVLPGPGGSNGIPRGARAPLSTNNLRRVYKARWRRPADLAHLDLRGPHDLRHTFATWLEDGRHPEPGDRRADGPPGGRRDRGERDSPMGMAYRDTTPEMQARVLASWRTALAIATAVAALSAAREAGNQPRSARGRRGRLTWGGAEGI